MQLGLAIAIALLIIAVVAWPLLMRRRSASSEPSVADESGNDNAAALSTVYDAIRSLQTDYRLGRVNEDDYREQLDEYRREAARILRDMDRQAQDSQND